MSRYRSVNIDFSPVPDDLPEFLFPGEPLSDRIFRAIEEGVGLNETSPCSYDDSDSTTVDPDNNIRTDRFALAESMSNDFNALRLINEQAAVTSTDTANGDVVSTPATDSPELGTEVPKVDIPVTA